MIDAVTLIISVIKIIAIIFVGCQWQTTLSIHFEHHMVISHILLLLTEVKLEVLTLKG